MIYRNDIDGIRALAVLAVVIFHAGFTTFQGGFVGVDVFFVLSGFLITNIIKDGLERGTFSLGEFYLRRIRRIIPALYTVLFASLLCAMLFFLPAENEKFAKSLLSTVFSDRISISRKPIVILISRLF